jgi:hypothetical protein
VQLLAQEEDPLTAVTLVSRLLEGVVSQDTATLLLQKVRKSARFHLVLDAGAASGRLALHKAVMKLLPPSKTTLALLGILKIYKFNLLLSIAKNILLLEVGTFRSCC